jgi:pyruvate formate-lyase activating enzyme-like uncharacterized protein
VLEEITAAVCERIANPVFRRNAQLYLDIDGDFRAQAGSYGLPIAAEHFMEPTDPWVESLAARAFVARDGSAHRLTVANDHKSLCTGWVSPSCVSCRVGLGTATYLFSTQCPRDCFFCFNHNQSNYEQLQHELDDPISKLVETHELGTPFHDLALTGGEPLLHKKETEEFFRTVQRLYPNAYTRLYTSGAFLDEAYLHVLADAGLSEIRFSVKTDDPPEALAKTFERMRLARAVLPHVMVEMPVMPDEEGRMEELLLTLDELGIDGINLLELCFPFHNAEEFARRGYAIKARQFRVLYNYWYSGGLPIAGSEEVCLRLLGFALERGLAMGVHYCSLENKFSGQVYLQNVGYRELYTFCSFSERDYFLKSAKVFGRDVEPIERALKKQGLKRLRRDADGPTLEFPPTYLERLRKGFPRLEVGISYHIVEDRADGPALRELRLDLTTPQAFDATNDL